MLFKKGIIPFVGIEFKLGDVVEFEIDDNVTRFGTITEIDDMFLDVYGFYLITINDGENYIRSTDIVKWYRKNKKGVIVPYCCKKLIEKYAEDVFDKIFTELDKIIAKEEKKEKRQKNEKK